MAGYNKTDTAKLLGISKREFENRAKAAGFDSTEGYYNSLGKSSGTSAGVPSVAGVPDNKAQEEDFLKRFRETVTGQPSVSDIYSRLSNEAGLSDARKLATGLTQQALTTEGRLSQLPEQIAGETRGFDVNAAQRGRIEEARSGDISRTLNQQALAAQRAGVSAESIAGDVGTRLGLAVDEQNKLLKPFEVEANMISERAARELTGYTANLQSETSRLIAKLDNQGNLDQIEAQRLISLAKSEQDFEKQKELIKLQSTEDIRLKNAGNNSGGGGDGW